MMGFFNTYADSRYAAAYAKLEFPNTYYLAFRDLPAIIEKQVAGKKALDFGCGTGRSTRFLQSLGFEAIGVDIAEEMIQKALENDPAGKYVLIREGAPLPFKKQDFHLIFSSFTFDNIPTGEKKVKLFRSLGELLAEGGTIINLVSTPEIYIHEWASFSTRDFPENRIARSGDRVKIIVTDLEDRRPAEDIVWTDRDYQKTYKQAGLVVAQVHRPLAQESDPFPWVNETRIAPWCIYVLKKKSHRI